MYAFYSVNNKNKILKLKKKRRFPPSCVFPFLSLSLCSVLSVLGFFFSLCFPNVDVSQGLFLSAPIFSLVLSFPSSFLLSSPFSPLLTLPPAHSHPFSPLSLIPDLWLWFEALHSPDPAGWAEQGNRWCSPRDTLLIVYHEDFSFLSWVIGIRVCVLFPFVW